jgi:hypothetical protein
MIIYRADENKLALATPEEEVEHTKELSEIILGALIGEGALSGKELKDRYGGGYSKKMIDMVLFAHPNIAKIGNTKSRLYYYTEDAAKGLPWLYA